MEKSGVIEQPEYILNNDSPKNISQIILWVDFLFRVYLKSLNIDDIIKQKVYSLISKKWWLSNILKDVFKEKFDFNSQEELDVDNLKSFLEAVSEIWDEIFQNNQELKSAQKREWWNALVRAWIYYFDDKTVSKTEMIIIENFFRSYLIKKYIIPNEWLKKETEEFKKRFVFGNIITNQLLHYVMYTQMICKISKSQDIIQLLLYLIKTTNNLPLDKIEEFILNIEKFDFKEDDLENIENLYNFITQIFPDIQILTQTKIEVETILLWKYDKDDSESWFLKLIPKNNFYFRKNEEIISKDDIFPEQWQMLRYYEDRVEWMKDINIFDTNWNKVFWWDIWYKDIENIKWTYYILTQGDWWRNVPSFAKWNIYSLKPAKDELWELLRSNNPLFDWLSIPNDVVYIDPWYMRTMAVLKIENWNIIKNNIKILL